MDESNLLSQPANRSFIGMTGRAEAFADLRKQIFSCESFEVATQLFRQEVLPAKERKLLHLFAVRQFISDDIDLMSTGSSSIVDSLMELCLEGNPDDHFSIRSDARELLRDTLESLPERIRKVARGAILDSLSAILRTEYPINACRTVAKIGYARSDIVDSLIDLANDQRYVLDAITAITSLGLAAAESDLVIAKMKQQIDSEKCVYSLYPLQNTGSPEALDVIREIVERATSTNNELLLNQSLNSYIYLTESLPFSPELHDSALMLVNRFQKQAISVSLRQIYSEQVLPSLYNWAFFDGQSDIVKSFSTAAERALELMHPIQLMAGPSSSTAICRSSRNWQEFRQGLRPHVHELLKRT